MLQRQIVFKQLQEQQRKQLLQELGNNRNQNYVNPLSSLKQASGGQYSPTLNETPVQDSSQMFMVGNMQMLQHDGPDEPVLSQNHNLAPQFHLSSYGTHAPNSGDNLNQYSHLQGPSNISVNPLVNNQSTFGSSFSSQRHNILSDPSNQNSNLFGQVPAGAFNTDDLSSNYSPHGFQKNVSFTESENDNENASSLDPLEQEILYNTDDNGWESAFNRVGKMSSGGLESKVKTNSLQSCSWSALMQSAVAETSSSDAGIQEEWSGLSFQNPESLTDTEKLQSDWVDRNLQNDSSPSSKPEKLFPNINSFTNFQQPAQYIKEKEEYHPESSHATMPPQSPRHTNQLVDNKSQQLFQGSLTLENIWPGEHNESSNNDAHHPSIFSCAIDNQPSNNFSGHEFGGSFWLRGSTSGHVSSIQKKYGQVNQMNMAHVGVSTESVAAPSESVFELLNKEDTSNDKKPAMQSSSKVSVHKELPNPSDFGFRMGPKDHPQTPQSHSFPPSFWGNSSATSLHIMSDYMKDLHPASSVSNHTTTQFPGYSAVSPQGCSELKISDSSGSEFPILENMPESKHSLTPDMLQHSKFPMGLPTPWPENHNSFRHEYQQPDKGNSAQEDLTEINNSTSLSRNTHHLEANAVESDSFLSIPHDQASNQVDGEKGTPFHARDIGAFTHSSNQNYSPLHHTLSTKNAESDNVNNQHSIANVKKLLLSGLQSGSKGSQLNAFWSGTASSMPYNQNPLQTDTSSLKYQHISPQMAPSWFKNYETMKDGQILPMYDARAPTNATHSFGEVTLGNLQESSLITQVNLSNANHVGGVSLSMAASSIACKQLNLPSVLPSDMTYGNLAVSVSKKRKLAVRDTIPWHKEVNHEQLRLQDISTAEYLWAEASNRKPLEATNDAEIVEGLLPVNRAKKRLVSTTQLMQQVFRPQPVFIMCSDATPNCDCVAYFAARLALGDAWCLTSQLSSEINNMSPGELKASKRTKACEFSEVVETLINRVKKVEADLSSLDKTLSFVDIKIEAQELEKFSIINRFAKFHIRSHPIKADLSSSSGTTAAPKNLQRYVVPVPMPKIVPEGQECISL